MKISEKYMEKKQLYHLDDLIKRVLQHLSDM